ncbi:MAG: hypothetical protein K9N49_10450 [Candidatus Marinimicrobia bacterium]|nr:hypothetical protein [Candidatus Neomarinimicrobiota bacterium]
MRITAMILVVALLCLTVGTVSAAPTERGGFMGFIAGCLFGVRTGGDYNAGKDVHWREWVMLVPIVNIVFAIKNGLDGSAGVTRADLAAEYGANYY